MQITVEHPDDLVTAAIPSGMAPSQVALEALAIEGYRTGHLDESQVRRMLGLSTRMQVPAFMAEHDTPLHYTLEHLELNIAASEMMHGEWLTRNGTKGF